MLLVLIVIILFYRYIAIVHPLHYSRYLTKVVTRLLMSTTWSVAVCISCIPMFWNDWHDGVSCEMNMVSESNILIIKFSSHIFLKIYTERRHCKLSHHYSKQKRCLYILKEINFLHTFSNRFLSYSRWFQKRIRRAS